MKKIIIAGMMSACLMAVTQHPASAFVNSRIGVGLNWDCNCGGSSALWGAWRNGPQTAEPPELGGGSAGQTFGAPQFSANRNGPTTQPYGTFDGKPFGAPQFNAGPNFAAPAREPFGSFAGRSYGAPQYAGGAQNGAPQGYPQPAFAQSPFGQPAFGQPAFGQSAFARNGFQSLPSQAFGMPGSGPIQPFYAQPSMGAGPNQASPFMFASFPRQAQQYYFPNTWYGDR